MRNVAKISPSVSVQIVGKISAFYSDAEKQLNFQKFQLKYKIVKHLRDLNSEPPYGNHSASTQTTLLYIKFYYVSGTKYLLRRYTEIYRHLLSKSLKNAVLGRQEMCSAKNVFSDTKQKYVCWKIYKSERLLAVLREHIIFNVK